MKKLFFILLASIFLIGFISAWSYDNSYSYGSASAYVKITGTYPACDGEVHRNYCAGRWYVDVSFVGDKFYLGEQKTSWPSASGSGYSGIPSTSPGRKYLSFGNGEFPKYILCAWDYDRASNGDWAWAGKCGGYLGSGSLDSKKNVICYDNSDCSSNQWCDKSGTWYQWNCKLKECETGQSKTDNGYYLCENYKWVLKGQCESGKTQCIGYNYQECINYNWVDKGIIVGECDVQCKTNSDCSTNQYCDKNYCVDLSFFEKILKVFYNIGQWFKGLF